MPGPSLWRLLRRGRLCPSTLCTIGFLGAAAALAAWAASQPCRWQVIAAYRTGLDARTAAQVHNVRLSARALDGRILQPGAEFSFNRTVGRWTADRGYVKAPVSYDGELIASWGGGVCQTSSTLYNAALLAGLEILERHRHRFPARYVPPGQDAAVAQFDIDLRLRNPYSWPVKIEAEVEGSQIICRILSQHRLRQSIRIVREIRQVIPPGEVFTLEGRGDRRTISRGSAGFHVAVYRSIGAKGRISRQLVSEDTYPPMNRLIEMGR